LTHSLGNFLLYRRGFAHHARINRAKLEAAITGTAATLGTGKLPGKCLGKVMGLDEQLKFELLNQKPACWDEQGLNMAHYYISLFVLLQDSAADLSALEGEEGHTWRRSRLSAELAEHWWNEWGLEDVVTFDRFWGAATALPGATSGTTSGTGGSIGIVQFAKAFDSACTSSTDGWRLSMHGVGKRITMVCFVLNILQAVMGLVAGGFWMVCYRAEGLESPCPVKNIGDKGWIGLVRTAFALGGIFAMLMLYVQGKAEKIANLGRLMHVCRTEMFPPAVVVSSAATTAPDKALQRMETAKSEALQRMDTAKSVDINDDGLLSKQEIRDWISTCPSIEFEDRY
jgi:hypothetical protein